MNDIELGRSNWIYLTSITLAIPLFKNIIVSDHSLYVMQTDHSQINATLTGFFGGQNHPHGVTTFDWTTMQYTWHGNILQGDRQFSSCALLRGDDGKEVVAIASGTSSGIEVWNPIDGSVKVLNDTFPLLSKDRPQLISVNNGLELIFYETWNPSAFENKGIWKFHQCNNSWGKIGEMLFPRDDFAALPVTELTCG